MEATRKRMPVGARWKALDLSAGAELFKKLDPDWPERLKLLEGGLEEVWEYKSASTGAVYRLQLTLTEGGALGACSCPGTRKSEIAGAIIPCKHIVALLALDPDCPIQGAGDYTMGAREGQQIEPSGQKSAETVAAGKEAAVETEATETHQETTPAAPIEQEAPRMASSSETGQETAEQSKATDGKNPARVEAMADIVHRCSALPLVSVCPAAVGDDVLSIGGASEAGAVGTAVHALFEQIVRGEEITGGDVAKACALSGCPDSADEVRMLAYMTLRLWITGRTNEAGAVLAGPVRSFFEHPQAEVELEHTMTAPRGVLVKIKGRCDLYERIGKRAVILDLKTGRRDRNHAEQLAGYAVAAMGMDKELEEVSLIVLWARLGYYDVLTMTRAEVKAWASGFLRHSAVWDGKSYTTGEHCTYCRRAATCEARAADLRAKVALFRNADGATVPAIIDEAGKLRDPDELAMLLGTARQIESCCRAVGRALESQIDLVGAQPLREPGKALGFSERSKARVVEPRAGWPVLQKYLSADELAGVVSVGLTGVLDTVAKKAEKGKGAAAKRQIEAELREAGALPDPGKSRTLTVIEINQGGAE